MRYTGDEFRAARFFSYLVPCLFALLLSACGFHLRGAVALPPQMERTQITGIDTNSDLGKEIADVLKGAGASVVPTNEPASAALEITGERFDRRVASVDPKTSKVTQYELRYDLSGLLRQPGSEAMAPAQQVTITRLLDANNSNALGTSSEEALLQREMRRDGVRQLIRQLIRQLRTALAHRTDNAP